MRRARYPVHAEHRAGHLVDLVRDRAHVVDGAEQVAHVRARDEAGARREQGREGRDVEFGVLRICSRGGDPPLDRQAQTRREADPRRDVGLVIELGEDELVAGGQGQGQGEVAEELGGRWTEDCVSGPAQRISTDIGGGLR